MTTARPAKTPAPVAPAQPFFRLPDIPEKHPDDMTSVDSLHQYGAIANIAQRLGGPDTTIVSAEHYVVPGPAYVAGESRYPDLLVAFGVDPAAYDASNGYIVSEQGKPPDFILEVASRRTASDDLAGKMAYYERMGVGEYWLYDRDGRFYVHPARLPAGEWEVRGDPCAGDRARGVPGA
ncbi:MAG: Uma2 family endonuclease [Chloroflexota bacterium]|nr:Uma2 family endonuclease [Chloroflexota bacterium]MDE2960104.1 Uma2 family endonuclease [Chloroflexota bacterium]